MKHAPIAVFAYRRADHLRNTLECLLRCEGFAESPVHLFFDGPRNETELKEVEATRKLAGDLLGDRAEYHFADTNQGLSRSIIEGVTKVINQYGRVIVIEDDLELAPSFLLFMNRALNRYVDDQNVFQVSGYMFNLPELSERQKAFFLPFTVSWGWATWARAWNQFDRQATGWEALKSDRQLRQRFNLDGAYDYATMLERQMQGLRDSWAIRWYWTVFKAQGLVLFPPVSFVSNMGFDGSGTHGRGLVRKFSKQQSTLPNSEFELPASVRLENQHLTEVSQGIRRQHGGWFAAVVDFMRRILNQ